MTHKYERNTVESNYRSRIKTHSHADAHTLTHNALGKTMTSLCISPTPQWQKPTCQCMKTNTEFLMWRWVVNLLDMIHFGIQCSFLSIMWLQVCVLCVGKKNYLTVGKPLLLVWLHIKYLTASQALSNGSKTPCSHETHKLSLSVLHLSLC